MNIKSSHFLAFISSLFVIISCGKIRKDQIYQPQFPNNKTSKLYLKEYGSFSIGNDSVYIILDNDTLGTLHNNQGVTYEILSGEHTLVLALDSKNKKPLIQNDSITFNIDSSEIKSIIADIGYNQIRLLPAINSNPKSSFEIIEDSIIQKNETIIMNSPPNSESATYTLNNKIEKTINVTSSFGANISIELIRDVLEANASYQTETGKVYSVLESETIEIPISNDSDKHKKYEIGWRRHYRVGKMAYSHNGKNGFLSFEQLIKVEMVYEELHNSSMN